MLILKYWSPGVGWCSFPSFLFLVQPVSSWLGKWWVAVLLISVSPVAIASEWVNPWLVLDVVHNGVAIWMNPWLWLFLLGQCKWLLSVPVVSSGRNGKSSFWMNQWLLSLLLSLSKSKWLLSVPVVAGGSDGEAGLWMNKWLVELSSGSWSNQ